MFRLNYTLDQEVILSVTLHTFYIHYDRVVVELIQRKQ